MLELNSSMQLFFKACPSHQAHCSSENNVSFSKTRPGCQHANLVNTLGVTQCDPGSPLQTLSYTLLHLFRYTFS